MLIEDLIQKIDKIDLEKSFPTNPNMTYFACVKAEIIASKVDFANKTKKLIFFDFRSIERVNAFGEIAVEIDGFDANLLVKLMVLVTLLVEFMVFGDSNGLVTVF